MAKTKATYPSWVTDESHLVPQSNSAGRGPPQVARPTPYQPSYPVPLVGKALSTERYKTHQHSPRRRRRKGDITKVLK